MKHLNSACACVLNTYGELLLGYRDYKGKKTYGDLAWGLPGGRQDLGETVLDTARRELKEEAGYDYEGRGKLILVQDDIRDDAHWTVFYILFITEKFAPEITEPDKHPEWRWVPLSEVHSYNLHPQWQALLSKPQNNIVIDPHFSGCILGV